MGCDDELPPKVWEQPITVEIKTVLSCLARRKTFGELRYVSGNHSAPDLNQTYFTPAGIRLQFLKHDFKPDMMSVFSENGLSRKQMDDLEDCRELLPANLRTIEYRI